MPGNDALTHHRLSQPYDGLGGDPDDTGRSWDIPIPHTTPQLWWQPWHTWENDVVTFVSGSLRRNQRTKMTRINRLINADNTTASVELYIDPDDSVWGLPTFPLSPPDILEIMTIDGGDGDPIYWGTAHERNATVLVAHVAWASGRVLCREEWYVPTLVVPFSALNTSLIIEALTRAVTHGIIQRSPSLS